MEIFKIIGIGTIIYLIYKFIVLPKNNQEAIKNKEFDEKVCILSHSHPEVKKLFKEFDDDQRRSESYYNKNLEENFPEKGKHIMLFDRLIYVFNPHQVEAFRQKVITLVNRLENDPMEKAKIEFSLKQYNEVYSREREKKEIKYLELRKNYLQYNEILKEIFPNTDIFFDKQTLIDIFIDKLGISSSEAILLFEKLSQYETRVLFESTKRSQDIHNTKYWYSEFVVMERLKSYQQFL